jgi:putative ABC transport system substrate-binding protein
VRNRRQLITLLGGAAVAWPIGARAQQPERIKRIGVLMGYAEADVEAQSWVRAFAQGLQDRGWADGSTIRIDYRWAAGSLERMRSHAAELVGLKPDVLLAASTPALSAVRQETQSVPIVFVNVADPIGQGFVSNLANPGGNITGFTSLEFSMGGKWIETLKEISPSVARAVVIFDPETAPYFTLFNRSIEAAGSSFAVKLIATPVHETADIERAINAIQHRSNSGLVVVPSAFMTIHRELIFGLAARHRLPAVYGFSYYAKSGGLVSYGINVRDMYLRTASYVDRILKGAKPEDLPVQAPTKFELVINLKTAKALGLEIPPTLLARADEVIE